MNTDMATMPIRELIKALRDKMKTLDDIALILLLGVISRRFEEQADQIDQLTGPTDRLDLSRVSTTRPVEQHRIGSAIARALGLSVNSVGRYDMEGGDKTETGLFKTILRIMKEGAK